MPETSAIDIGRTAGELEVVVVVAFGAAGRGEMELESFLVGGREGERQCPAVDKRYDVVAGEVESVRLCSIAIKFAFSSEVGRDAADEGAATLVVGCPDSEA